MLGSYVEKYPAIPKIRIVVGFFWLWFVQQLLIPWCAFLDEFLFLSCLPAPSFCACNEDVRIYDITSISMATGCRVNNICIAESVVRERAPVEKQGCEIAPAVNAGGASEGGLFYRCVPSNFINRSFQRSSKYKEVGSCVTFLVK